MAISPKLTYGASSPAWLNFRVARLRHIWTSWDQIPRGWAGVG